MASVILNWIYIAIITFVSGFMFLYPFGKHMKYEFTKLSSFLWAGLVIMTVYAQIFSLFGGVSLLANLIVLLSCIIGVIILRKPLCDTLKRLKPSKAKGIGILILLLLLSFASSRGYMAYDTGLYHAQAIRWIENCGVAPGLGLLHSRFAYNSSSFALSALFSFSFLPIQPIHAVAGFMALLLGSSSLDLFAAIRRKKLLLSDFVRVGVFYYLTLIFNEVVAPTSDYFSMLTVFYIVLAWAQLLERKEKNATPFALLCVVSAYAVSLKLSAGLLVFLAIQPVIMLIKDKKAKYIWIYLLLGIAVILPFLVRGVVISGWLLFPTTVPDLFTVPWKIPKDEAIREAREIQAWGRGLYNAADYDAPLQKWIGPWFLNQSVLTKGMLLLDGLGVIVTLISGVIAIARKKKEHISWLLFTGIVYASFFLWLFSAPLVRYGYAYIILPFLLAFGYWLSQYEKIQYVLMAASALFLLYKSVAVVGYIRESWAQPFYLQQMPYEEFELESYEVYGHTFYMPKQGDQVGYESFPAMPYRFTGSFRGEELRDGFVR